MKIAAALLLLMPLTASAQNWDSVVDSFFDTAYFPFAPSAATSAGFHQYDTKLEDFSHASIERQRNAMHQFETEIQIFPVDKLSVSQGGDRELILSAIRSTLLDLEGIRYWETNPDKYSSAASNAAFVIMSRTFRAAAASA